jgi:PBSX family phage portal protein
MAAIEAFDDDRALEVSLGGYDSFGADNTDLFAVKGESLRDLGGVNSNLKRKIGREISKAYTGMGDAKTKATEISYYSAYDAFGVVLPPYNLDYLAQVYELNAAHYAACNAKVSNIVGLGFSLVTTPEVTDKINSAESEQRKHNMRAKVARAKTKFMSMLDQMNYEDTFLEVLQKAWIDYEATGNGYIEIGRTATGTIGYIGHVASRTVRVRRLRDGYVQIVGAKSVFFRNFGDTTTKDPIGMDSSPNELIHIKKYSPRNTYYGVSDIVPAMKALAGDDFAQQFNLDYFEHKAAPRYVIVIKGASLSTSAEKKIHEFFMSKLKGKHHRSLYIPLPADTPDSKVDFKMTPVEGGVQDGSFDQYRQSNRNDILMAHRVPLSKVGHADGLSLGGAADADKGFKEQVTRPEQDKLEKRLNRIVAEFTDMFTMQLNEMSLTDEDKQSQIEERLVRMKIKVPNESREKLGLPPMEGGDQTVDLKSQQAAEQTAQAMNSRTRDQERSSQATDGKSEPRNPKGQGRTTQ